MKRAILAAMPPGLTWGQIESKPRDCCTDLGLRVESVEGNAADEATFEAWRTGSVLRTRLQLFADFSGVDEIEAFWEEK